MEDIYTLAQLLLDDLESLHTKHKAWTGVSFPRIQANIAYVRKALEKPRVTDNDISSIVSILTQQPSSDPRVIKGVEEIESRYDRLKKSIDVEDASHQAKCEWLSGELFRLNRVD